MSATQPSNNQHQTLVQDLRIESHNPNQVAENWDTIIPSDNLIKVLVKTGKITNHKSGDEYIICLGYSGHRPDLFYANLSNVSPDRNLFFKQTESEGIDWNLYRINGSKLTKACTVLHCSPSKNALFTGSIFDTPSGTFAMVTVANSKLKLTRKSGDTIPLQKIFLYQLNSQNGNFEICKNQKQKSLEFKPQIKNPFDWRDPNPALIISKDGKRKPDVYFVACGTDKNNQPCVSRGKIKFDKNNKIYFQRMQPIQNLPNLIYQKQSVKPIYLECPQKIIDDDSEILICSVGAEVSGKSEHFLVGYLRTRGYRNWRLANGTGLIDTGYPTDFGLYAPKAVLKNGKVYLVGWNSGPSGLPHSQSPPLELYIDTVSDTIRVV